MNGTRVLAIVFVALLVLGVLSAAWAPSSRAPASAAAANTRAAPAVPVDAPALGAARTAPSAERH